MSPRLNLLLFRSRNRPAPDRVTGSTVQREATSGRRRRKLASAMKALRHTVFPHDSSGGGYEAISGDVGASGNYGLREFRVVERWRFLARPFLSAEKKAKISIGTLHVGVVEARGLMATDLRRKSDPYIKLTLTGRYLSRSQEWSENMRIKEQTRHIKNTLDPVWNEDFSLPIRRAGAVLKVEVLDRDFTNADDELGGFEIKIGEELLSQKPTDMWYVLEAPRGMELAAAAFTKAKRYGKPDPVEQDKPVTAPGRAAHSYDQADEEKEEKGNVEPHERDQGAGDENKIDVESTAVGEDEVASRMPRRFVDTWSSTLRRRRGSLVDSSLPTQSTLEGERGSYTGMFKASTRPDTATDRDNSGFPAYHCHESEEEARSCVACIEVRRRLVGEVRLKLRFEFDEFGEACSHLWPEEPPTVPPGPPFSPNRIYYTAILLLELARPYVAFMLEANAVVTWVRPWTSFLWMIALSLLLIFPFALIVAFNAILLLVTLWGYLNQTLGDVGEHGELDAPPGTVEEGAKRGGINQSTSSSSSAMGSHGNPKRDAKTPALWSDFLDPAFAAGDVEMGEMYTKVGSAKKLPVVVEEVGRRVFSVNGAVLQRQAQLVIVTLMNIRRMFRPLDVGGMLRMTVYLTINTLLQLWLYLTGRFNLYLLLICFGVFSYYFYYRRGKAFIMAVKEALRCRKVRLAYSVDSPSPISPSSTAPGTAVSTTGATETLSSHGSTKLVDGSATQTRYPAFAPPGATPVERLSDPREVAAPLSSALSDNPGGSQWTTVTNSLSRGTDLFRHSIFSGRGWFTPTQRRRVSDPVASGPPVAEEGVPASTFFTPPIETSNEGNLYAPGVLLPVASEQSRGPYIGRTSATTIDTGLYGSVQHQARTLGVSRWSTPWRRDAGNDEADNADLANQDPIGAGHLWARRLTRWASE